MTPIIRSADGIYRPGAQPIDPPASATNHHPQPTCARCRRRKSGLLPRQVAGKWGVAVELVCISCTAALNGRRDGPVETGEPTVAPEDRPLPPGEYTMTQAGVICNRRRVTIHTDVQRLGLGHMRPPGQRDQGRRYRLLTAAEVEQLRTLYRERDRRDRRGWRKR